MKCRSGITLIEVLVAIFIMGVGLLAILTLFPLGIMTAAQALQDDRVIQLTTNVTALVNGRNLRNDTTIITPAWNPTKGKWAKVSQSALYVDPYYAPLDGTFGIPSKTGLPNTKPIQALSTGIQRVNLPWVGAGKPATPATTRWFTLIDDYNFLPTGFADTVPAASANQLPTVKSNGIYTCGVLLRRPQVGNQSYADMSIVVYKGRSTQFQQGETSYQVVTGTAGTNQITVNLHAGQLPPAIRKSGWILDTTTSPTATNGVQADFYQVISVTPVAAGNTTHYILETQVPLKNQVKIIMVLENVVDVIDRGFGWN